MDSSSLVFATSTSELVNQFGAIIGISTILLTAFVYLFTTAKKGRQDIVRQDNADLRASNQEMRTERAGMEATITENRETIRQLRDIATQTPAVTKLLDMIGTQQQQSSEQHTEVIQQLSKLTGKISDLAGQFGTLAKALNDANKKEK